MDPNKSPKRGNNSLKTPPILPNDGLTTVSQNTETHPVELLSWKKVVDSTPFRRVASCQRKISRAPMKRTSTRFASACDKMETTKLVLDAVKSKLPMCGSGLSRDLCT